MEIWEDTEKTRIATHEKNIFDIKEKGQFCQSQWREVPIETLEGHLKTVESINTTVFEEFEHDATTTKFLAIESIKAAISMRQHYENEQKELVELRAQAAETERLRIEAENEALAKQHEEKIKAEALAKTQRQQLEEERAVAEKRANDNVFKELREADVAHRGKINREAAKALAAIGMNKDEAKTVISAIARKMIPNVRIEY